jgi:hypothetical protein
MEYQFLDFELETRRRRPSANAQRVCSLTGYGVRFRTPIGVTETLGRTAANLPDETFVKQHKFPRLRQAD